MHVVHLYDGHEQVYDGRGSIPSVVWNVARETVDAGHEVTVIERQWEGLEATASHQGVRFERLNLSTGTDEPGVGDNYEKETSPVRLARSVGDRVNFAWKARRRLLDLEFDVLHVHLPYVASVLLTVARGYRSRTVFTAHLGGHRINRLAGVESVDIPRILSAISPDVYLAKRAARTTVLNRHIEAGFKERGVPEQRLRVIPNGVDIERFTEVDPETVAEARERYWPNEGPALLFVGTVMPRKGVDDLVRAVAMLHEGYDHEPELVIAGEDELDGEYVSEIRALVRERGLTEHVTLTGFVPEEELPALYAAADIFVSPSLEEEFGMTVAEAMAAGTPVVATRVGGVARLLDAGACGRMVEPNHPTGLAATLDDLLSDDERRQVLAGAGEERIRSFSWPAVAEQFIDVYESVSG